MSLHHWLWTFAFLICCKGNTEATKLSSTEEKDTTTNKTVATPQESPEDKARKWLSDFIANDNLDEAIETMKPKFDDAVDKIPTGVAIFLAWANKNLRYSDIMNKGQTTFAQVMKDSDSERGKKICVSGSVVEIKVVKVNEDLFKFKYSEGELRDGAYNIYRFYNVKSSGDIVESSWATTCGVVIGRYDYSNSGGGTSHAIALVGMFYLDINKDKDQVDKEKKAQGAAIAAHHNFLCSHRNQFGLCQNESGGNEECRCP
jgi:hypothetical protein